MIAKAAIEQRENLQSILWDIRRTGRIPTWCTITEYTKCVELIEWVNERKRVPDSRQVDSALSADDQFALEMARLQ